MGRNPLKFGRRKSSTSALDEIPIPTTPPVSTFRVLERPDKINLNGDSRTPPGGVRQVTRPFNSPLGNLKGRSVEELSSGLNRGSAGTTNSGSSGYYESSSASVRHSSSSTLPSSVDADREPDDEELFPKRVKTAPMYQNVALNEKESPPPPPSSFSTRAARAFSFGNRHNKPPPALSEIHVPPVPPKSASRGDSPKRERAMTTSSYASTAKPDVGLAITTPELGNDFGNLFDRPKSGDRFAGPLPPVPPVAAFHRTESEPMFPPQTHSRDSFRTSPELSKDEPASPYGWDRNGSKERLMAYSPLGSPTLDGPPPPPPHRTNVAAAFLGQSKPGYSSVPERYSSPGPESFAQDNPLSYLASHITEKDEEYEATQSKPEGNSWAQRAEQRNAPAAISQKSSTSELSKVQARVPSGYPSQASAGASKVEMQTPYSSEEGDSFFAPESMNSTPKAAKLAIARQEDDSLFDSSPVGPPSRAIKPQHSRAESNTPKKMTKAQFERLQRRGDASGDQSEEEEEQRELDEYDEEDDSERARQISKQRQKQEANMSVYRQQMKKVTGGGPTDLPSSSGPRPSIDRAPASAPAAAAAGGGVYLGGIGGKPPADAARGKQSDDDDEDVPLGILQAHGFPSSSRPPTRGGDSDAMHQRRTSTAGSVVGASTGQGGLPPFARRLPADPYFGSSVVNQTNREALGMTATPSAYGGPPSMPPMPQMMPQQPPVPQMGHPGGLVGVIAGEERAKAARRGSPNPATGAFGASQTPLPMMGGVPGMLPRSMSMGNVMPPQSYMPSGMPANPMMGMNMPMMSQMQQPQSMPNPQQDQMQQFMSMQMQVMQNMLQMQQVQMGQTPPAQPPQTPDYLGVPGLQTNMAGTGNASKAPSIRSHATNQGRAMTMMHPPNRWELPQQGPRPNSAMPQTYAPSGLNITNGNGLAPGYTASIAPSERSNIGMPSRYRPVTMATEASDRTNSMSSTNMLQAYGTVPSRKPSPEAPQQVQNYSKPTIRAVDKPKGAMKVMTKSIAPEDDEDEGWAEMRKKREERKRFRFGKKDKSSEISLEELVHNLN